MEKTALFGTIGRAAWNVAKKVAPGAAEKASTMATNAIGGVRTAFQPVMQNGVAGIGQTMGNIGTGIGNAAGYMWNGLRGVGVSQNLNIMNNGVQRLAANNIAGGMSMLNASVAGGLNNPLVRTGLAYGGLGTAGMAMM